jgi:glutathionyl-hydroquinone reductase
LKELTMLMNGKWTADWHPVQAKDEKGGLVRQTSSFRNWVTPDGSAGPTGKGGFPAEVGRYHLYVALTCPWASRALIGRRLKNLEDAISVSVVEPALTHQGWRFGDYPGADRDSVNGATYLHEVYTRANPAISGWATVPVLWDKTRGTIVNNESADILRMMNSGFGDLADPTLDLSPEDLREKIDALNARVYLERILAVPGMRETVSIDHIKRGYYSIKALNPTEFVPRTRAAGMAIGLRAGIPRHVRSCYACPRSNHAEFCGSNPHAWPARRGGKREISEICHQALNDIAAFVHDKAKTAVLGKESQPELPCIVIDAFFAQAGHFALAQKRHQARSRDPEPLCDDHRIDLDGAILEFK